MFLALQKLDRERQLKIENSQRMTEEHNKKVQNYEGIINDFQVDHGSERDRHHKFEENVKEKIQYLQRLNKQLQEKDEARTHGSAVAVAVSNDEADYLK